jgi:hypothetical protein
VKEHTADLPEVHHPQGLPRKSEVLLQGGKDHQLQVHQIQIQDHQENLLQEIKEEGNVKGINEGRAYTCPFSLNIYKFGSR